MPDSKTLPIISGHKKGDDMGICPFADYRPLAKVNSQPLLHNPNLAIVHTMGGGTLDSTDAQFRAEGFTGLESHFGIGGAGELTQWGDTRHTADANADANDRAISIETADGGRAFPTWKGSDVPPWNDAQLATLIRLLKWICDEHGIPPVMVPDSRADRRGIAGHRQGINSSPAGQPGYRKPGTQVWSAALGKVCPGDARFAQLRNVVVPAVAKPAPIQSNPGDEEMVEFVAFKAPHPKAGAVYVTNLLGRRGVVSGVYKDQMEEAPQSVPRVITHQFTSDGGMNAYAGPLVRNEDSTVTDYNPATDAWETH